MDLNEQLIQITGDIDTYLYTYILVILLVAAGLYFSFRTKFVQIRFVKDMFSNITEKKHDPNSQALSSFQAMMISGPSRFLVGSTGGQLGEA